MTPNPIDADFTPAERVVIDQLAALTQSNRADVLKKALAVYHWFVRQIISGSTVVARKPGGEESALVTPDLAHIEGQGNLLSPDELGALARKLTDTADPREAAQLRERITRGFYGV